MHIYIKRDRFRVTWDRSIGVMDERRAKCDGGEG